MYWRLHSLPELQHLSEQQRHKLLREATGRFYVPRLVIHCFIAGFGAMLVGSLVFSCLFGLIAPNLLKNSITALLIMSALIWIASALGLYQYQIVRIRGQIRLFMEDLKTVGYKSPICLECGYAIEEESKTCPECGAPV